MKKILLPFVVAAVTLSIGTADADHSARGTVLVINPNGGDRSDRFVLTGSKTNDALAWIAKYGLKKNTRVALAYKGKVYRKRSTVLKIARRHKLPTYRICGKVAPEEHVRAVHKYYRSAHRWQAIKVSFHEGGWRTEARNGQYRGTFQMGTWERATYGHGSSYDAQARASSRYFYASGADWSPWEVKPWWGC